MNYARTSYITLFLLLTTPVIISMESMSPNEMQERLKKLEINHELLKSDYQQALEDLKNASQDEKAHYLNEIRIASQFIQKSKKEIRALTEKLSRLKKVTDKELEPIKIKRNQLKI